MRKIFSIKKLILAFSIILFNSLSSYAQWIQQNSGTNVNLYDIEFINKKTGWAVGDAGVVIKTTNEGLNWINVPNPSGQFGGLLWSVYPVDSQVVFVVAGYDFIMKSSNGGDNWAVLSARPGSTTAFKSLFFLNRDTGWFLGTNKVFRTYDGGNNLDSFYAPWFTNWDIFFKDSNNGIFCGTGKVFKTTNGGISWFDTMVPTFDKLYEFHQLAVVNDVVWVAGGSDSPIYRSTDFCDTWEILDTINNYPPSVATCISFSSKNTGWIGGTFGHLYKTSDGGHNWLREETGSDPRFWRSIYSYDDSLVWGTGGAGRMYYTTTGGQTLVYISTNENTHPEIFKLHQNYPNPFNNETIIEFDITEKNYYNLEIFDALGRRIEEVFSKQFTPGKYKYYYNPCYLSSGAYTYKLSSKDSFSIRKFILLR